MNAPRTSLAITSLILLFASPALAQTQPGATGVIDARPTGLDAAGATLALGEQDAHWEVSDDLGATWVAAIYGQNNYCGSCGGRWLDWPLGDDMVSRGITHPSHVEARIPGRTFSWRQRFVLPPGALVDTARIAYTVGYDDYSRNAADDGNLSGTTSSGSTAPRTRPARAATTTAPSARARSPRAPRSSRARTSSSSGSTTRRRTTAFG